MGFSCGRFRSIQQLCWMKGATWCFCSAEVSEIARHEALCGFRLSERAGRKQCQPPVIPRLLELFKEVVHLVLSHLVISRDSLRARFVRKSQK